MKWSFTIPGTGLHRNFFFQIVYLWLDYCILKTHHTSFYYIYMIFDSPLRNKDMDTMMNSSPQYSLACILGKRYTTNMKYKMLKWISFRKVMLNFNLNSLCLMITIINSAGDFMNKRKLFWKKLTLMLT